jgi:NTE family protein
MKSFILFLTLLASVYASAQTLVYKNLVLEGGGTKGFAYAGAFQVLDSLGILKNIERVGGTSAGAIQATLLAIGYSPEEMKQIAASIPLKEFNDGFLVGGLHRMKKKFGFFKGEKISEWMEQLIATKTGNANLTFRELHELKTTKNYKDLYITGTDLTSRSLKIFSFESYPDMRIKDAVRISFSIPLYFEPVRIDEKGAIQKDRNKNYDLMVDGGLLSNYPIHIFDSTKYMNEDVTVNKFLENNETLGLLLDKPEQIEYNRTQAGNYPLSIRSLTDYGKAVYLTIIDKPNPDVANLRRTITISHLNLSGRVRKLSTTTIEKLMDSGRQGVRLFFTNNNLAAIK